MNMARTGYDFQSLTQENRDWKEARAMSKEIIQFDQAMFETKLDAMVRDKVEQIVNAMLDEEADLIANAARYERSDGRKAYRAGHYARRFTVKAGRLGLKVPKLKGALFESAVIERYRRREQSVEESLIDMYLAGVSTRRVDDISQLLWGERMPSQTLSDKLRKVYDQIDEWRNRPLGGECPYVFMDGVWHKRSWGGSVENVSVLVAIGVDDTGHREVIGVAEGMKEDKASWEQFIRSMIERGLKGVRLVVGDRCAGIVATVGEMLPQARYQRCMVHFMRNVLSKVPPTHREWASACISSSRCFVFSHVFFSGLGSCMHFPYFSGCAEVFLPNMRGSLTRRLWPVNSRSRPWCTMRSMIAAASLSSAKTVPHLLNSMFVVNMMLRLS